MNSATHPASNRCARAAFTLIELLVVISIIALLVSILVPTLGNAKWLARVASCAQNMHNVGVSSAQYSAGYQLDTPWIYYDGTGDGPTESSHDNRGKGSGGSTTPGNPAEALLPPSEIGSDGKRYTFEQFADDPAILFCPCSNKTAESDYHPYGDDVIQTAIWGTYRYVYPHLAKKDDPFNSDSPKKTGRMAHTNSRIHVSPQSAGLVMPDLFTGTPSAGGAAMLYDHYNGLLVGGAVEQTANTEAELNTYLFGVGYDWYE